MGTEGANDVNAHASSTAPSIPRELWTSHSNYPAQVLLLGSHENFRRISRRLIAGVIASESVSRMERAYSAWIAAMRSHEAYEERKLYPYLARRWNVSFELALGGHRALHEREVSVREALASARAQGLDATRTGLLAALEAHDTTLSLHLGLEEDLVIPLLLELAPKEFDDYYNLPIEVLMARFEK